MRLNNYLEGGPYAYLTDRPTTIPADAPLVVFDTRSIPDAKAAAALFVICEHVKSRIARTRREHLAGESPKHAWAGRSFLVIDEAWKLIERPATGRWFNEFCRRSRHQALWLIAISQQLSDFDNEHGKALLANAAMRLFLRQEARELSYVKGAGAHRRGDRRDLPAADRARATLDGLPDERLARTGDAADRRRAAGVLDRELRPRARRAHPPAGAQGERAGPVACA